MKEVNDYSRRSFLKRAGMTPAGVVASVGLAGGAAQQAKARWQPDENQLIWGYLVHLGYNMWSDRKVETWGGKKEWGMHKIDQMNSRSYMRCDKQLWDDIIVKAADVGMNMLVIDLAEAVQYKSHPELAVKGSWSHEKIRKELDKMRSLGIEPIPKLNFSTAHDIWLGPYSRCISTPTYYDVCADLIAEVSDLFDKPRFFHLGYEEEKEANQKKYDYAVMRQHGLWWHDLYFLAEQVEKNGGRPWVWSDYCNYEGEDFYEKMPQSILQSTWCYSADFEQFEAGTLNSPKKAKRKKQIQNYLNLDKHGFDQIPTSSNFLVPENTQQTVDFCTKHIDPKRLKGFLQTCWVPTLEYFRDYHMETIQLVGDAIAKHKA